MASSCLHWVTRLVLTMFPPQMTMMTGAPGLTPLSCSARPSSPEYAEASTEPQAISTNIRWSSANLSHEMSSNMHVIFHRSIDMIVTINGVIRYQNEIYCTSSYLTQAAFASLSDTSMDITRSGCKQFLVYFSVLCSPLLTFSRQRSSSLSATLRAPRLVAWLVMASRVTLAPALRAWSMEMVTRAPQWCSLPPTSDKQFAPNVSMATTGTCLQWSWHVSSPWSSPRARPPPPTQVTKQPGTLASPSWALSSVTRLLCPAQVVSCSSDAVCRVTSEHHSPARTGGPWTPPPWSSRPPRQQRWLRSSCYLSQSLPLFQPFNKESQISHLDIHSRSYLQLLDHQGQSTLWYEQCQRLPYLLGGHSHGHARVSPAAAHKLPGAIPDGLLGDSELRDQQTERETVTCMVWPMPRILKLPPGWRFSSFKNTSLLRIAERVGLWTRRRNPLHI